MLLNNLIQPMTTKRVLVSGAVACYAAVFTLLIYALAVHARLDSWRESSVQTVARLELVTPSAAGASCAEIAGMGRRLCSAETKIDAVRARFEQRVATYEQRHIQPAAGRVKRLPAAPTLAAVPPADLPAQAELPINSSIAARE